MCIAILNKKDSLLSDEVLTNSFLHYPDGCGFAYINNKQEIVIDKGLYTLDQFLNKYKNHKKQAVSDMLIHCRISTSGKINVANAHPHIINNDLVLIHNGILDIDVPINSTKSDTIIFIDKYLKNLTIEQLQDPCYLQLLADFIGNSNKFIILDRLGNTYIINSHQGITDSNNNWFSNNSFKSTTAQSRHKLLTKKDRKQLKQHIKGLTVNELYFLGEDPEIDLITLQLTTYGDMALLDIDERLYNYYLNLYYEKIEQYPINNDEWEVINNACL